MYRYMSLIFLTDSSYLFDFFDDFTNFCLIFHSLSPLLHRYNLLPNEPCCPHPILNFCFPNKKKIIFAKGKKVFYHYFLLRAHLQSLLLKALTLVTFQTSQCGDECGTAINSNNICYM